MYLADKCSSAYNTIEQEVNFYHITGINVFVKNKRIKQRRHGIHVFVAFLLGLLLGGGVPVVSEKGNPVGPGV